MSTRNWGLTVALGIVFGIQVYHLSHDFGPRGDRSAWLMAFAYMLAITSAWGAIFTIWCAARGPVKIAVLLLIPPLFYFGDLVSVEASKRVFAMKKHTSIEREALGNTGAVLNNRMVHLCQLDMTSAACADAIGKFEEFKATNEGESASAKAMGAEGDDGTEKVSAMAHRNAWGLEVLNAVLAILNSLWLMEVGLIAVNRNSVGIAELGAVFKSKKPPGVTA